VSENTPELEWLREKAYAMLKPKRILHVQGCEKTAVELARRYGADEYDAAESAILHDITKKCSYEEQLILCEKYGIICDSDELKIPAILHAKTGAAAAKELFGVPERVEKAIRYHTTGRPDMTELEKIIYLADCIEPTRTFEGVDEVRALAEKDLDKAMALMLKKSLEFICKDGDTAYKDTVNAEKWYRNLTEGDKI